MNIQRPSERANGDGGEGADEGSDEDEGGDDLKCDCRALGLHLLRDGRIATSGRRSEYAWERALDAERLRYRLAIGAAQESLVHDGAVVPMSSHTRRLLGRFVGAAR